MTCPKCDGPSRDGLCQSCELDDEHEYWEKRAEEMGAGTIRTGPDASDVHVIGGDSDE